MKRTGPLSKTASASLLLSNEADSLEVMVSRFMRSLAQDRTGAITVEYAMLVSIMMIMCLGAFLSWGPHLMGAYNNTRGTLMLPIP